jgi:predicted ester cyclase
VTTQVDANAKIALTIFEAWNTKDYDRAYSVLADDFKAVEVATGATFAGPTGLKQEYTLWHTAMSDGRIDVTNVISAGDSVAIESMVRGTHDGLFVTDAAELTPTGQSIEFPMCTIAAIVDGAYALERHYFDMQSLLKQFGAG